MPRFNSAAIPPVRRQLPACAAAAAAAAVASVGWRATCSDTVETSNDVVKRYCQHHTNGVPDAFGFRRILRQIGAQRVGLQRWGRAAAKIDHQIVNALCSGTTTERVQLHSELIVVISAAHDWRGHYERLQ